MELTVNLTPELERFAESCVENGRFADVSDVVLSGLRMLQEAEHRRADFVRSLEDAVAEGDRDGFLTSDEVRSSVGAAIKAARPKGL